MNKKAALQLSINAIVVLILAITILGLGLGFIKSQFGALTKQFSAVSEEIEQEIINKIRDSGDLLVFDRTTLSVKTGKPDDFFMGIKNTDAEEKCFRLQFTCKSALKTANSCGDFLGQVGQNDIVVGGFDEFTGQDVPENQQWFSTFFSKDINGGGVGVLPVKVQIAGASSDTYLMEISVFKGDSTCSQSSIFDPYQTKEFFIELA